MLDQETSDLSKSSSLPTKPKKKQTPRKRVNLIESSSDEGEEDEEKAIEEEPEIVFDTLDHNKDSVEEGDEDDDDAESIMSNRSRTGRFESRGKGKGLVYRSTEALNKKAKAQQLRRDKIKEHKVESRAIPALIDSPSNPASNFVVKFRGMSRSNLPLDRNQIYDHFKSSIGKIVVARESDSDGDYFVAYLRFLKSLRSSELLANARLLLSEATVESDRRAIIITGVHDEKEAIKEVTNVDREPLANDCVDKKCFSFNYHAYQWASNAKVFSGNQIYTREFLLYKITIN